MVSAGLASDLGVFLIVWRIVDLFAQKLASQYCNRLIAVDCAVYEPGDLWCKTGQTVVLRRQTRTILAIRRIEG